MGLTASSLALTQYDVEEVQDVMHDAVGRMLNNRENLEVLEDRADILRNEGLSLANTGRRVRRDAQSRHRRLRLAVCLGVAAGSKLRSSATAASRSQLTCSRAAAASASGRTFDVRMLSIVASAASSSHVAYVVSLRRA